jgi:hypothetical protein
MLPRRDVPSLVVTADRSRHYPGVVQPRMGESQIGGFVTVNRWSGQRGPLVGSLLAFRYVVVSMAYR